jgi:uncharacterized membrane protein YdjX (TVP38/TMEM64 family)
MRRPAVLVAVAAALAAAALWASSPGARAALDPQLLAARLRDAGPLGALGLLGLLVVQCVVAPIPSEPIMMAAGFVYGPRAGFALSWAGVCLGAALCFLLARRFGRPLAERFVRPERLSALDARLAARGLVAVFLVVLGLRLFTFTSFDVLSYACGLLRFPLPWFLVATGLGAMPKVFAFTYAGATAGARPGWLDAVILAGTFGVLIVVPWLARRWRPGAW